MIESRGVTVRLGEHLLLQFNDFPWLTPTVSDTAVPTLTSTTTVPFASYTTGPRGFVGNGSVPTVHTATFELLTPGSPPGRRDPHHDPIPLRTSLPTARPGLPPRCDGHLNRRVAPGPAATSSRSNDGGVRLRSRTRSACTPRDCPGPRWRVPAATQHRAYAPSGAAGPPGGVSEGRAAACCTIFRAAPASVGLRPVPWAGSRGVGVPGAAGR